MNTRPGKRLPASSATLTHKAMAWVQFVLSAIFVIGYFAVLILFLKGDVHVPDEFADTFKTLLGSLSAGVGLILFFWFNRQRASGNNGEPK